MIILNIYGILAIVVISFVGFYLHTYWPSLYEGSYFGLTLGVLTLLVGSVMERMGARGRIFFMPVWLVGVLLTAYAIFLLWGVAGLILPAILVIIAVWWLTKVIKKNDALKWEKAKHWMEQFRAYKDSTDSPVFWQLVKESLFFRWVLFPLRHVNTTLKSSAEYWKIHLSLKPSKASLYGMNFESC